MSRDIAPINFFGGKNNFIGHEVYNESKPYEDFIKPIQEPNPTVIEMVDPHTGNIVYDTDVYVHANNNEDYNNGIDTSTDPDAPSSANEFVDKVINTEKKSWLILLVLAIVIYIALK